MKYIYSNIKQARKISGLKQKELAKKVGIAPSYISMIESGTRDISLSLLFSIAEALEIHPIGLFEQNSFELLGHSRNSLKEVKKELLGYKELLNKEHEKLNDIVNRINVKIYGETDFKRTENEG